MTALAISQVRYESLMYWRNRRRVFFTFALPLMFVVIFGALYGNGPVEAFGNRGYLTFFIPGILAFGVILATFTALGFAACGFVASADSAPMVGNVLILPLTFISGVWGPPPTGTLHAVAQVFPVARVADALQHAYDPGVTGTALSPADLLVLGIWALVGLRLTQRFLRREIANA